MSDVVRQRLESLFAQLQPPPDEVASDNREGLASGQVRRQDRWVDELESPDSSLNAGAGGQHSASAGDAWLARLRSSPQTGETEGSSSEDAGPVRSLAGKVLAFSREHLATVAVVLLVGTSWTVFSVMQAHSTPVADAAPVIQASPTPAATSSSTSSSSSVAAKIVVHVIGAVAKPGVVKLPDGSRIADAITAAGGLKSSAATGELNLAQVLSDGTQLKIGTRKHPGGWIRSGGATQTGAANSGGGGGSGTSGSKVSLNSATVDQLDTLPGIGPVTAEKIVSWRKAHGKFTAITELQEVDGIGPKTYADISALVGL